MSKVEKILESKTDERTQSFNGMIYKRALEKIVIITNIIYMIIMYTPIINLISDDIQINSAIDLCLSSIIFTINFITFSAILKAVKKYTFCSDIKKSTFYFSSLFIVNFLSIIWSILRLLNLKNFILINDIMFFASMTITLIITIITNMYIIKKYK